MMSFLFTKTPLLFLVQSFWRDEAFTYILAKKSIPEIIYLTSMDFNPPIYYILVHFWTKIFGSSEISIRSISFVFYWLTLYVVYLFLKNVFNFSKVKIIVYVLLTALNPFLIYYAFEARMYSLLAFIAALSFYAFITKKDKLYLISTLLGLYIHYFMVFTIFVQAVYKYIIHRKKKFTLSIFKNQILLALLFLPWLLYVSAHKSFLPAYFWIEKPTIKTILNFLFTTFTGSDKLLGVYFDYGILVSALFLTIIIVGAIKIKKTAKHNHLLLLLWSTGIPVLLIAVSYFIKPVYYPRYFIFCSVGLILLLAVSSEALPRIIKYIIVILLFTFSLHYQNYLVKYQKKSDYRRLYHEIKSLLKPQDEVYVTSELDYFTAQYYIDEYKVYIYGKSHEELPDYVGKILIPKNRLRYSLPRYPKKAFVITSDSQYDIRALF